MLGHFCEGWSEYGVSFSAEEVAGMQGPDDVQLVKSIGLDKVKQAAFDCGLNSQDEDTVAKFIKDTEVEIWDEIREDRKKDRKKLLHRYLPRPELVQTPRIFCATCKSTSDMSIKQIYDHVVNYGDPLTRDEYHTLVIELIGKSDDSDLPELTKIANTVVICDDCYLRHCT